MDVGSNFCSLRGASVEVTPLLPRPLSGRDSSAAIVSSTVLIVVSAVAPFPALAQEAAHSFKLARPEIIKHIRHTYGMPLAELGARTPLSTNQRADQPLYNHLLVQRFQ